MNLVKDFEVAWGRDGEAVTCVVRCKACGLDGEAAASPAAELAMAQAALRFGLEFLADAGKGCDVCRTALADFLGSHQLRHALRSPRNYGPSANRNVCTHCGGAFTRLTRGICYTCYRRKRAGDASIVQPPPKKRGPKPQWELDGLPEDPLEVRRRGREGRLRQEAERQRQEAERQRTLEEQIRERVAEATPVELRHPVPSLPGKLCACCGLTFHPRKAKVIYCSRRCAALALHGSTPETQKRPPTSSRGQGVCLNCRRVTHIVARGLCHPCYRNKSVRGQYPKFATGPARTRRLAAGGPAFLPAPTPLAFCVRCTAPVAIGLLKFCDACFPLRQAELARLHRRRVEPSEPVYDTNALAVRDLSAASGETMALVLEIAQGLSPGSVDEVVSLVWESVSAQLNAGVNDTESLRAAAREFVNSYRRDERTWGQTSLQRPLTSDDRSGTFESVVSDCRARSPLEELIACEDGETMFYDFCALVIGEYAGLLLRLLPEKAVDALALLINGSSLASVADQLGMSESEAAACCDEAGRRLFEFEHDGRLARRDDYVYRVDDRRPVAAAVWRELKAGLVAVTGS